ncbi:right-handed parallel beta-helix repeat-containing protein [Methanobrevibacter sp.]|uniref:right-handed parallel beta-helix repeat-containing protein n=1 Tax=Methanobrevibacter sp. TaxID=66852 RepID=UPI00388CF682
MVQGNHHTIDARGSELAKFIVTGKNVIIYDLKFVNFKAANNAETSNIVWNGNNGIINSCDFYNNTAANGGAISWNGNGGHIKYCLFENNSASKLGGALYITGENVEIISTTFNKFTSQLYNEAIYFSNKSGQILRIDDCYFTNTGITDKVTRVLWDEGCTVLYNGVDMSYATIEGLYRDIENLKPGDYYNIERDYVITNPTGDLAKDRIINIKTDNIVIDGNGHIIDCGGVKEFFGLFNITGNNVTITNLRITNSRAYDSDYIRSNKNVYGNNYNHLTSPIEWHGNNGIISNCQFYDNVGDNGGLIYWTGSNGKIENSTFDDNAAKFGGSIYVSGNDNLIKDCTFNNSYATNHYEAIYFKNINNPKLTINNCLFESGIMSANSVIAENGCEVIFEGDKPKNVFSPMSFKDLIKELEQLKDGDIYNFDRDCYFDKFDGDLTINANNIIINGNGYKIFGRDSLTCLLNIFGNNVQINDLTFDFDSSNIECPSFMTLTGENVSLSNCVFIGNEAQIGGTVNWYVNNGIIDNCLFINNAARAIYMDGTNNIIANTSFINTFFTLNNNEIIYYVNRNGGTENGALTINNCSFESDMGVKIWIDDDSDVIIDGKSVPVTFDQLYDEISNLNENEVYDIYRDYYTPSKSIVIKNDNITINANGHSIIALDDELNESVIRVEGNGIKINKLTINANSNLRNGSLIDWAGDCGVLSDSTLKGNTAEFGGAINWSGNNGIIDASIFINNSAIYAGGAIFIDGANNTFSNCNFVCSGSKMADEAIFIGKTRKHLSLLNVLFIGSHNIIDAFASNVNIDYLTTYQHEEIIADESINLYPLVYASIMKGGVNNYNDDISYYGSYNNQTGEFVLCIVKEFPQLSVSYTKEFIFKNLFEPTVQDVFDSLSARTFENMFKITKTEYVSSASDYIEVINKNHYEEEEYLEALEIFYKDLPTSKAVAVDDYCMDILNVVFTQALTIDCDKAWDFSSAFDNINIDGNESVIKGSFEDRQEDKWAIVSQGETFSACNIQIEGFNTAVENMGGVCIFDHVNFNENKMDYYVDRDWGAAILNAGLMICTNCVFTNNYAKNGGAIFTQGLLSVENCTFSGNVAYGQGNDICVGDDGQVLFNGVNVTGNDQVGWVHFAESMSIAASTAITVFTPILATVAGFIAGAVTANPMVGIAVGALVGGAIGAASSVWINEQTFDVSHDRLATTLTLTIISTIAGGYAGGFGGGAVWHFNSWMHSYAYERALEECTLESVMLTILKSEGILWAVECSAALDIIPTSLVSGISYYFTND